MIIFPFLRFFTDTSALTEAHRREVQRRSDAAIEHASVLPPDVVSVLTQCDQIEQQREEIHQQSHAKLMSTIEKFFSKLEAEEKKYRTRMEELQVCAASLNMPPRCVVHFATSLIVPSCISLHH